MNRKRKKSGNKLALSIPSRTEKLRLVRRFVSRAARDFGFSVDEAGRIALAVDEACTNIIKHAYKFAEDKDIDLSILMRNGRFEVVITDSGESFDPNGVEMPDMKEYLLSYQKGGLGMFLMRTLMDKVEYDMKPGVRNQVRLVKYLP